VLRWERGAVGTGRPYHRPALRDRTYGSPTRPRPWRRSPGAPLADREETVPDRGT